MIESDNSETEERNTVKLKLNVDVTTRKRLRIEESENEEQELYIEKCQNSVSKQSEILNKNNIEDVSIKNIDEYNVKREKHAICLENKSNVDKQFFKLDVDKENLQKQDKLAKQNDESENSLDKNHFIVDENLIKANIEKEGLESKDIPIPELITNTNTILLSKEVKVKKVYATKENEVNEDKSDKKSIKEIEIKKDYIINNQFMDTEVVDGLELSVECASDKEELSSESENETNVKPRPKTIIVKVKPEESELECSSEDEKSNLQEISINTSKIKSEKRNVKRKDMRMNSNKMKTSGSEDSQNNNSDEDYNPRTKKKIKRSPKMKKQIKHVESRKGQNKSTKKNSLKKNIEYTFDDESADITLAEKTIKIKTETEDLSEKESSISASEKNSEDEKISTKEKYSNNTSKNNKHIQILKRYLNVAGIKVRSYNDIWADCKNNTSKIKRLKELLEKNGVSGRPTLEKCKRVKEKNEKMREISELDVSNIISEERVTRARRNTDNGQKVIFSGTPSLHQLQHREAHNTFKRIKTVIDSDSE